MGTTLTTMIINLKMKTSRKKYWKQKTHINENIIIKMEQCDICPSEGQNTSKKKHCLTKKLIFFSTLIFKKNVVRNPEIDKLIDITQPYYNNH